MIDNIKPMQPHFAEQPFAIEMAELFNYKMTDVQVTCKVSVYLVTLIRNDARDDRIMQRMDGNIFQCLNILNDRKAFLPREMFMVS